MFRTFAGGFVAVLVLVAIVAGLMQLHAPTPAFACPTPEDCADGCHWTGNCWYVWFQTVGGCCYYETNSPPPCPRYEINCN